MQAQRFGNGIAHALQGVEGGHRFLKHHADARAAYAAPVFFAAAQQLLPVQANAALYLRMTRQQAHDGQHGQGFAAARFANQPPCFAMVQRQVEVVQWLDDAVAGVQLHRQMADVQQSLGSRIWGEGGQVIHRYQRPSSALGSSTSRRPSPKKFSPKTASAMQMPGYTASAGRW